MGQSCIAAIEPDHERALVIDNFASLFGRQGSRDVYVGSVESGEVGAGSTMIQRIERQGGRCGASTVPPTGSECR